MSRPGWWPGITLVVWGDSDHIADADYGRAVAKAIPGAHFQLLRETGHLPQIETPGQLLDAVWAFTQNHALPYEYIALVIEPA